MNSVWVFLTVTVAAATSSAVGSSSGNYAARRYSSDAPAYNYYSSARSNYPSNYSPAARNYQYSYSPAPAASSYPSQLRSAPSRPKVSRISIEGKYAPPPPGTRVYYVIPGSPRLFPDVESAVANLPDGNYKLFYIPPKQ